MLNLTLVLGRYTHTGFFYSRCGCTALSSCSSGLRACLSNCRQRKCNFKTNNSDTNTSRSTEDAQMHGSTAVQGGVCEVGEVRCVFGIRNTAAASLKLCGFSFSFKTKTVRDIKGNDTDWK